MIAVGGVLEQLGMLDDAARAVLEPWLDVPIKSVRGIEVGRYKPHVALQQRAP